MEGTILLTVRQWYNLLFFSPTSGPYFFARSM